MTFTRGRQQDSRPLFSVGALVFDNGVLDRLTVETGLVTVTADLECPGNAAHPQLSEVVGWGRAQRNPPDLSRRTSDMPSSIVWFRHDLRLADNPAVIAALGAGHAGRAGLCAGRRNRGRAAAGAPPRAGGCITACSRSTPSLACPGSRLILRRGPAEQVIPALAAECDAHAIYWNRIYDQGSRERDTRLKQALQPSAASAARASRPTCCSSRGR